MSVYQVMAEHRSAALILRLLAAGMVFWAHASQAFSLGFSSFEVAGKDIPIAEIGLLIFFGLSGILIAASADKSSFAVFAIRRFQRIWPGLTFMVIFTGLVFAPYIAVKEGMGLENFFGLERHLGIEYLSSPLYIFATSPGAFSGLEVNPNMPGGLNGSLWTIPIELQCYVASIIISRCVKKARLRALLYWGIAAAFYSVALAEPLIGAHVSAEAAGLVAAFFFGSAIAKQQFCAVRTLAGVAIPMALGFVFALGTQVSIVVIFAPIFPLASTAFVKLLRNLQIETKNDYSFGLYLWHYPIIQTVWAVSNNELSGPALMLLSIVLSGLAAYASWHVIEKRFIKRKPPRAASN